MRRVKKLFSVIAFTLVLSLVFLSLSACKKEDTPAGNPDYLKTVSQYPLWANTAETSIPNIR